MLQSVVEEAFAGAVDAGVLVVDVLLAPFDDAEESEDEAEDDDEDDDDVDLSESDEEDFDLPPRLSVL